MYVCAAMHLSVDSCLCISFSFFSRLEHKHVYHKDGTQMVDVLVLFAFAKAAGLSVLD